MTPGSAARRYARALHDLAREEGNVDDVASALGEIAEAVQGAVEGTLSPGALGPDSRARLGSALAAPFGVETTLGKFLRLVAERDRISDLPGVHHWFLKQLDEEEGRVRASITTATTPTAEELDSIVATFRRGAGREVVAEVTTDEKLLGGVIVELEGRVYDGSIRTRLARLAARMSGE
ncbi:MAG: ATP synthase F1 subunit delta [Candidatus Binatia bacterium]